VCRHNLRYLVNCKFLCKLVGVHIVAMFVAGLSSFFRTVLGTVHVFHQGGVEYCRVLVLESGRVREFDSPAVLLGNKNSHFYLLAKDAGLV